MLVDKRIILPLVFHPLHALLTKQFNVSPCWWILLSVRIEGRRNLVYRVTTALACRAVAGE